MFEAALVAHLSYLKKNSVPHSRQPFRLLSLSYYLICNSLCLFLESGGMGSPVVRYDEELLITRTLQMTAHGNTRLTVVYTNEESKVVETLQMYEQWLEEDNQPRFYLLSCYQKVYGFALFFVPLSSIGVVNIFRYIL